MKTNVAPTSIDHYHKPETQKMILRHEEIVFRILLDVAPLAMTLKEITHEFNARCHGQVPDSSLCAPLNILKAKGKITDDGPKRRCRINGIMKKTWAVADASHVTK